MNKRSIMFSFYYIPGILGFSRILITLWFLVSNPLNMPLHFLQFIVLIIYIVVLFMYFKLYNDGVPVISILSPTLLHFTLVTFLLKRLFIIPFVVLLFFDICFLICKSFKASMYPFEFSGDEIEEEWIQEIY